MIQESNPQKKEVNNMNVKKYTIESGSTFTAALSMERVFIYILTFDLMENSVIPFYVGQAIDPIRRFENHTRIAWHYGKFIRATKVYLAGSVHKSVANKAEQDMIARLSVAGYSLINIAISDASAKKRQRAYDLESWTTKEIYEYSKQMPTLTNLTVIQDWRDSWTNRIIPTKTTKYTLKPKPKRSFSSNFFHPSLKTLPPQPKNKEDINKSTNNSTSKAAQIFKSPRSRSEIKDQSQPIPARISKRQLENYVKSNPPVYKKMVEYPKPARNPDKNKLNGGSPIRRIIEKRDEKYGILDFIIRRDYNETTGLSETTIPKPLISVVYDYLIEPSTIWQTQNRNHTLAPLETDQKLTFSLKDVIIRNIKEFR